MKLTIAKALHTGIARVNTPNQDAVGLWHPWINPKKSPIFVLADGMGGYQGGEIASKLVVTTLISEYRKNRSTAAYSEILNECIHTTHKRLRVTAQKNSDLSSMGTTLVALICSTDQVYLANVGDSRAYLIRDRAIQQYSYDHTVLHDAAMQSTEETNSPLPVPSRSLLSMAISASRDEVTPYITQVNAMTNDIWVLCSDGLWSVVEDSLIASIVSNLPAQVAARRLIDVANSRGGPDNISVLIIRYGPEKAIQSDIIYQTDEKTDPGE